MKSKAIRQEGVFWRGAKRVAFSSRAPRSRLGFARLSSNASLLASYNHLRCNSIQMFADWSMPHAKRVTPNNEQKSRIHFKTFVLYHVVVTLSCLLSYQPWLVAMNARWCPLAWWRRQTKQWNQCTIVTPLASMTTNHLCFFSGFFLWLTKLSAPLFSRFFRESPTPMYNWKFSLSLRRKWS